MLEELNKVSKINDMKISYYIEATLYEYNISAYESEGNTESAFHTLMDKIKNIISNINEGIRSFFNEINDKIDDFFDNRKKMNILREKRDVDMSNGEKALGYAIKGSRIMFNVVALASGISMFYTPLGKIVTLISPMGIASAINDNSKDYVRYIQHRNKTWKEFRIKTDRELDKLKSLEGMTQQERSKKSDSFEPVSNNISKSEFKSNVLEIEKICNNILSDHERSVRKINADESLPDNIKRDMIAFESECTLWSISRLKRAASIDVKSKFDALANTVNGH